MCSDKKGSNEESSSSSGSVTNRNGSKGRVTRVGAKRRQRSQPQKEVNDKCVANAHAQNGSILNQQDQVNATGRSLRSRTVRCPEREQKTSDSIAERAQSIEKDDNQSGMRLRSKRKLDKSTPKSETASTSSVISVTSVTDGICPTDDVYEFTDSDDDTNQRQKEDVADVKQCTIIEKVKERAVTPTRDVSSPPTMMTSPGGRLKLTLRMKRSPVLDEVIESGSSMTSNGHPLQQNVAPVYEVLRVEGLEMDCEPEEGQKNRVRRTQRRRSPSTASSRNSSTMPVFPTTKRLRLIFGNESHTIDIPPTNASSFSAVD